MQENIGVWIEPELHEQANALFNELGLDITTATRLFLKQSLRENGLPFDLKIHTNYKLDDELMQSLQEAEDMIKYGTGKVFHSLDELWVDCEN